MITPTPKPVSREDALKRLASLETRVATLEARLRTQENRSFEDELQRGQHQNALEAVIYGIQNALTSPPVKFNAVDQKAWDEATKGKK